MAWAWVQSASGSVTATTVTVSYTTQNVASGNKLIALVSSDTGVGGISSVKDGAGNSMTQIGSAVVGGSVSVTLWAMDVPAGDAGTKPAITATFSNSGDNSLLIQEVSALAAGNTLAAMIDGTAGTATGTTSPTTSPAYSSTASNEYLVCCFGDNLFSDTYTSPAGYTADPANVTSGSAVHAAIAYKNSTGGAETGQYTFTGAGLTYGVILVAFKITPPAATTTVLGTADDEMSWAKLRMLGVA